MKAILLVLSALLITACSRVSPPDDTTTTADMASDTAPVSIASWGPQGTTPGVPVNAFPGGESGLYFTLSRPIAGAGTEVLFDGKSLGGVAVNQNVVTAMLPASDIAKVGKYRIVIKLGSGRLLEVGDFIVAEPSPKAETGAEAEAEAEAEAQSGPDGVLPESDAGSE